jgi:putative ABC transport system ATP-binding protein
MRQQHFPAQLSGGECQRVAIARAIATRPKILFADEPSGNLDSETGNHVMDLLFDLVKKNETTLVLVTHNETHAHRCGRHLQLALGRLKPFEAL